jgi:hypothetical protein
LCFRCFKLQTNLTDLFCCFDSIKYNKCFLNCQGFFSTIFPKLVGWGFSLFAGHALRCVVDFQFQQLKYKKVLFNCQG